MKYRLLALALALILTASLPACALGEGDVVQTTPAEAFVEEAGDIELGLEGEASEPEPAAEELPEELQERKAEVDEQEAVDLALKGAPKAIHFDVIKLKLGVGEICDAPIVLDEAGNAVLEGVTITNNKPKIIDLDESGTVKALKTGSAVITATLGKLKATCKVTVSKAPTKLTVTPAKLRMGEGQTGKAGYKLSSGAAGAVTWYSEDETVAVVDPETGEITAVGGGEVTLTARTYNGLEGYVAVTVFPGPESVTFESDAINLGQGQKITLAASVNEGAWDELVYSVEDASIAKLKGTVLTAVNPGVTRVIATACNGVAGECEVTVKKAPEKVTLPWKKLTLGVGETVQLEPDADGLTDEFTYTSSSKKVASVTEDGLVETLKAGSTSITAKTYNKKSAKVAITVLKAPESITAIPETLDVGVGEHFTVDYSFPKKSGGSVTMESSDPSILEVDELTGEVTAVASGEAEIIVRAYNGVEDACRVKVYEAPDSVDLESSFIELSAGQMYQLEPIFPAGTLSSVTYTSDKPSVAKVSADGVITAVAGGSATILVETSVPDVYTEAFVTVWEAPSKVTLEETSKSVLIYESFSLEPIIPENSRTDFTFESSNTKVAMVDEDGVVDAVGRGQATITVFTHNGKKAKLTLKVVDPWYPESVTLTKEPPRMDVGETYQLKWTVKPETADAELLWSTSNSKVAKVSQDGLITAVGKGNATITAVSLKNEGIKVSVNVAVGKYRLTLVIPEWTTDEDGIEENLDKIDAVRKSAISEISRLYDEGTISKSEATKRKSMVNSIFENYAFPWKTLKKQKYWKAANSEGGVKDFQPDRVYFGLPYISGSGDNRHYNVALALKEKRYYDSGEGYYILNQNKLLNSKYVGNDCSGLCNVAIWGTGSKHTDDRTTDIASNSAYKTIKSFAKLRPGDLLCKSASHVQMFLYFANDEQTEFMIIENGGIEPGTNTVHVDIYPLSWYQKKGYSVRRLASF